MSNSQRENNDLLIVLFTLMAENSHTQILVIRVIDHFEREKFLVAPTLSVDFVRRGDPIPTNVVAHD